MKFHRIAASCAAFAVIASIASCSSAEPSSSRVKNSFLSPTPMLVNGLFNKDQGGWVIDGVGPVEKGCAATTGNVLKRRHPSLGHAFESTLTFGRDPSSVSQAITVPTPGTVTFAVTLAKLPPNQQMVIRIATAQNFPKVVATKTGTYSVSLVTHHLRKLSP